MKEEVYRNAFKEIYEILKNTDEELVAKIPKKFLSFIEENMNNEYECNIQSDVDIDKQNLLKETEAILALIYINYWATEEEKQEFALKDQAGKEAKEKAYDERIQRIFEERKVVSKKTENKELIVKPKEKFIKRIINKIRSILKNKGTL